MDKPLVSDTEVSATDVLVRAMERAGKMKHVLMLYEANDDEDHSGGYIVTEHSTISQVLFMLKKFEHFIFS